MAIDTPMSKMVVIDTEQYAGNFEREMCAYITGQYGDCGVGEELAEEVFDEIRNYEWFADHINNESDEHECYRPVTIWPTNGWYNNGNGEHFRINPDEPNKKQYPAYMSVAIFVDEFPEGDVLLEICERAEYFCENKGKFSRFGDKDEKLTFTGIRFLTPSYSIEEVKVLGRK